MKYTSALIALVSVANAVSEPYMEAYPADPYMAPYPEDPYADMQGQYSVYPDYGEYPAYTQGEGYDDYFQYENYVKPDYDTEWANDKLPGPDFNKQCYEFNTCEQIWDQDAYEYRVEVEAKLLVGIEALKESVQMLKVNMARSEQNIMDNNMSIRLNQRNIYANMDAIITSLPISQSRVGVLQGRARSAQGALDEDLAALVLYCQQFAWAPEMVAPCAEILVCAGRELPYRTQFPVVEYVEEYIEPEYMEPEYMPMPEPEYYPEEEYMRQPY